MGREPHAGALAALGGEQVEDAAGQQRRIARSRREGMRLPQAHRDRRAQERHLPGEVLGAPSASQGAAAAEGPAGRLGGGSSGLFVPTTSAV